MLLPAAAPWSKLRIAPSAGRFARIGGWGFCQKRHTPSGNIPILRSSSPNAMDQPARRHSRWWEVILFSDLFHLAAGLIATVLLPATVLWGSWWYWLPEWGLPHPANWNALITASVCFLVSARILSKMRRYSAGGGALANILPVVAIVFLLAFMLLLFLRSDYSRALLLISFTLTLLWCYAGYFLGRNYQRRKYAVLPAARKFGLQESERIELRYLDQPDLEGVRYDAIVADLRSAETSGDWERFLAECILAHIPVFHAQQVVEALTGRVHIDRLSENAAGALTPSPLYAAIKRVIDTVGALVLIPLTSPIMAIAAVAIRLDSAGPAVFKQKRVGLGNKDFTVYKFRSMRTDVAADSERNNTNSDDTASPGWAASSAKRASTNCRNSGTC